MVGILKLLTIYTKQTIVLTLIKNRSMQYKNLLLTIFQAVVEELMLQTSVLLTGLKAPSS